MKTEHGGNEFVFSRCFPWPVPWAMKASPWPRNCPKPFPLSRPPLPDPRGPQERDAPGRLKSLGGALPQRARATAKFEASSGVSVSAPSFRTRRMPSGFLRAWVSGVQGNTGSEEESLCL